MDLKFRIKNIKHSKDVQKLLFKLGFGWSSRTNCNWNTVQHTKMYFLFTDTNDNTITYAIGLPTDDNYFLNELTREEALLLHPKQLTFLNEIQLNNSMIATIISKGFYLKKDQRYLNNLLNQT